MWNESHAGTLASQGAEPNDSLWLAAHRIPEGPVLRLAEGGGRHAVYLAERRHAVTAVDLSEVGLANAAKLAARRAVELTTVAADLASYDPAKPAGRASSRSGRTFGTTSARPATGPARGPFVGSLTMEPGANPGLWPREPRVPEISSHRIESSVP